MAPRRSVKEPLSRTKILETALRLIDKEGLPALSMRRLAGHLGVEAMSLYNHVADRGDLLDGVTNLVLSRIEPPDAKLPWQSRLEAIAMGLYKALLAHPPLVTLLATTESRVSDPTVMSGLDMIAAALGESGLSRAQQVSAFRGLIAMIFGFVMAHTQGFSSTKAAAEKHWAAWDSAQWIRPELPNLSRLAPQFLKTHADDDLRFMMQAYFAAIAAQARANKR
jgi:TetR/AcrR family tetracycline transcriptional repressor